MTKLSDPHWYSDIEAPLQVCESDTLDWSMVADVVVIGAGCSGICASIEAADRGARVICIDRFGGGGATTLSGGVVYAAAASTSFQHTTATTFTLVALIIASLTSMGA